MSSARKAQLRADIAQSLLNRARQERRKAEEIRTLAQQAAEAQMALARATVGDAEWPGAAEGALRAAKALVQTYKLTDMEEAVARGENHLRRMKARAARLADAEAKLKAGKESGNEAACRAARAVLAQVYLEFDGDVVAAAEQLAGTGDQREKALAAAAEFARAGKIDPAGCLGAVEEMSRIAKSMEDPVRSQLARTAKGMCQAYLDSGPAEVEAARARLLMAQLQVLLGASSADKRRQELADAYGGLNGKLEIIDEENVRVLYDFSDAKQLADWQPGEGAWAIGKGVLGAKTRPYGPGRCDQRLRFRADRPFKLSFDGSAKHELSVELKLYPWGANWQSRSERFSLRDDDASLYVLGIGWSDRRYRIAEGNVYRFEISTDGKGGFAWSVNNVMVYAYSPPKDRQTDVRGAYVVQLRTESADRSLTVFDNAVMEGAVLSEPLWRPPEKKADEDSAQERIRQIRATRQ